MHTIPIRGRPALENILEERARARQRKSYKISPNNPVRRRLVFEETVEEQSKVDNFTNILQESAHREMKEKTNKYNFDFSKENALEGRYQWYKKVGDEWVEMEPQKYTNNDEYKLDAMQYDNENTPARVREVSVSRVEKRKNDLEISCKQSVKRSLNY